MLKHLIADVPGQRANRLLRNVRAGREFGGGHHATVLHSINKIEAMRRSEKALDRTIVRLEDTLPLILVS